MKINGQNHFQIPVEYETNKLSLGFASLKEEQEFKEDYSVKNTFSFRLALILAFLSYVSYVILRWLNIAGHAERLLVSPDIIFAGIVIILLILTFTKPFYKFLQTCAALLFISAGYSIITTSLFWPENYLFFIISLIFVTIYGYSFLKLRFILATIIGWILLISLWISYFLFLEFGFNQIFNPIFALMVTNVIGMLINYRFEVNARKNFVLEKLFGSEKIAHEQLINELDKTDKRSTDLLNAKEGLEENKASLEEANMTLATRLKIAELLNECSRRFLRSSAEQLDESINHCLKSVAEYSNVDRGYVYLFQKQDTSLVNTHIWCTKGIEQKIKNHEGINNPDFVWLIERIRKKESIIVNNINQMPSQASSIQTIFSVEGVQSFLLRSLFDEDRLLGFIGLDSVKVEKHWNEDDVYLLEKAAELLVSIIERKKSLWVAKKSEDKLSALIERTDDVVFITTPEGKILDINPAGAKLFGYPSVNALYQATIDETFYENPADRRKFQKIMEEKGQVKGYELVLKRKDGKRIVVLETAKAVRDEHGKIVAYEGIMRDVTEQRQLERQLFQSQKMESIGLLAGGIAHDFNNIVTAINGYADMILMSMPKNHPHYKNVVNILKGGKRAEKLTRQLLAFSRKQIIKPKIVDINVIISELAKMLRRLIGEDIIFETKLNSKISNIQADPGQIQQVLVNLVVNARDAINDLRDKSAEKRIVISTDETELTEEFVSTHPGSRKGKHVVLAVRDTGIGIDDEIKSKMFEPFFTTKEEGRGTGLGLSTVYGIVKQNNSSIYTESAPGKGTTFFIYWPTSVEEKTTTTTEDTSAISMKKKSTVLVVEDDENVRELACSFLTSLGYNILEAEDGLKAMEILNKNNIISQIDVLLTDIVMPGMRGDELAERVKKMKPEIKIILTSGYTDSDIIQSGIMNEEVNFLPKPYTIKQMAKKIEKILEG